MEQARVGKYNFICFTDKGRELVERLADRLCERDGSESILKLSKAPSLREWTENSFEKGNVLVFVGACGIAVRAIAPFVQDKTKDPAVVVIDEKGQFVIPLLSGHIGGGVKAARKLADLIGATCVNTTATDVEGEFAVDVFASDNDMVITDLKKAKEFTARLLKTGDSTFFAEPKLGDMAALTQIPENIKRSDLENAELVITTQSYEGCALQLIPRCVAVGMGCKKGKTKAELKAVFLRNLEELGIDVRAVKAIASVDIKKDEAGLIELARELGAEFVTFSAETLMAQEGDFTPSAFVKDVTGVDNVCERAVAAFGAKEFICRKKAVEGVTFAAGLCR